MYDCDVDLNAFQSVVDCLVLNITRALWGLLATWPRWTGDVTRCRGKGHSTGVPSSHAVPVTHCYVSQCAESYSIFTNDVTPYHAPRQLTRDSTGEAAGYNS